MLRGTVLVIVAFVRHRAVFVKRNACTEDDSALLSWEVETMFGFNKSVASKSRKPVTSISFRTVGESGASGSGNRRLVRDAGCSGRRSCRLGTVAEGARDGRGCFPSLTVAIRN